MMTEQDAANETDRISGDRSFWGMLLTQFLGAFNDNFFKQFLLFVCIDLAAGNRADSLQGTASTIFAVPFILLSGYCGYLSDKFSKRSIVVLSKVLEIVVMGLGLFAFLSNNVNTMLTVLFFMGAQSALFGPSKYGILPELFPERQLPRVNGAILMTTFLSIILALWLSGEVKESLDGQLWRASFFCIGIAVLGTVTSLLVRHTPIAHPDIRFDWSTVAVSGETWRVIRANPRLWSALIAGSVFWMVGGVVYPMATNDLGKIQFGWSDGATGRLAACTGIGITIGCLVAGHLSQNQFDARLVRLGAIGMLVGLILLSIPGSAELTRQQQVDEVAVEIIGESGEEIAPNEVSGITEEIDEAVPKSAGRLGSIAIGVPGAVIALIWLGFCAGLFTVPLQVLLQAATPKDHKGRVIGAMNLFNWIGLALSGVYYNVWNQIFTSELLPMPCNAMYGAAAILLLPIVCFYRPATSRLDDFGTNE